MRKPRDLWLRIPRPVRAALNLLAVLALVVVFYVSIGAPTVDDEHAFRRAERANLLGPSTILFNERVDGYPYGTLILAQTDDCVITWVDDATYGFNYHEKTGDITIVTGPKYWFDFGAESWYVSLPVFVVDNYPDAVRAELDIEIQGHYIHNTNNERLEEPLDHRFSLEASREQGSFFHFDLALPSVDGYLDDPGVSHGVDGYALDALAQNFTNVWTITTPQSHFSATATVRLFNEQEELIAKKDLILRTMTEETIDN